MVFLFATGPHPQAGRSVPPSVAIASPALNPRNAPEDVPTIAGNLLADLGYAWVDPRVSLAADQP